jgi:hypothetical protein
MTYTLILNETQVLSRFLKKEGGGGGGGCGSSGDVPPL